VSLIDDYLIPFHGLKEGIYNYSFEAGDDFFSLFENPDILGGNLKIELILNRKNQFLEFDFHLKGYLLVPCDRCLEAYQLEIDTHNKLFVRFSTEFSELSDTVITIPHDETRINIAQYIYEFSALALPVQKIHPDQSPGKPGCSQEMLERLGDHTPDNNGGDDDNTDPRWDALKKLK